MCLINERFVAAVVSTEGFVYLDEGTEDKPRWGYVANTTGAKLVMRFNTMRPSMRPEDLVSLYFHHLKSYEHMGAASLRYVDGVVAFW